MIYFTAPKNTSVCEEDWPQRDILINVANRFVIEGDSVEEI